MIATQTLLLAPIVGESLNAYLAFVIASGALVASAIYFKPSVFVVVLTAFLTSGFFLKSLMHTTFGAALIEPVGSFSGSAEDWNTALGFATAGLAGATLAVLIAALIPVKYVPATRASGPTLANMLFGLLSLIMLAAVAGYLANYEFMILRIGQQPKIILNSVSYGVFAFAVTWGFLLASLSVTLWLVELGRVPYATLVYVGSLLGFLASVSMSSRVQFLLYLLAAASVIVQKRDAITKWRSIALSACAAVVLFGLALSVVTIDRVAELHGDPPPAEETSPGAQQVVTDEVPHARPSFAEKLRIVEKFQLPLTELRSLIVMRWIGLEGVMVTAGDDKELGASLVARALAEEPSAGTQAIYQRMAGDKYIDVKNFTFLTMPGVIGFGSYTGSYVGTAFFTLVVVLFGHLVGKFASHVTQNAAAAAVSGVALAYLVAQFNVPWTLAIFVGELVLALSAFAVFWRLARWYTASDHRSSQA